MMSSNISPSSLLTRAIRACGIVLTYQFINLIAIKVSRPPVCFASDLCDLTSVRIVPVLLVALVELTAVVLPLPRLVLV